MKLGIFGLLAAVMLAALVGTLHPQTAEARIEGPLVALMANGNLRVSWTPDSNIQPDRYEVQFRIDARPRPLVTRMTSGDSTTLVVDRRALKDRGNMMKVRVRGRITVTKGVERWLQWSLWSRSFAMADFATGLDVQRLASGNLSVKWNPVSGAARYTVKVECITAGCTDNRTLKVSGSRSYSILSTQAGVKYRARVRAVKGSERGPWTAWMTETTPPVLPAISNYEVHRLSNGKVRLKWDLVPGAEWYEGEARCITAECVNNFSFKIYSSSLHTVQEWQPGNDYRVRMRATNADGTSAWTSWKTATPVPQMPSISNLNVQRLANGWLGIKWDPIAEAGWYEGQAECTTAKCTEKRVFRTLSSTAGPVGTEYSQRDPISDHLTDFLVPTTGLEGYRARVRAVYAGDYGPWTDWVVEKPLPVIAPIKAPELHLRSDQQSFDVKWLHVAGADYYIVEMACGLGIMIRAECISYRHEIKTVVSATLAAGTPLHLIALGPETMRGSEHNHLTVRVRVRAADEYGARPWSEWSLEYVPPLEYLN